MKILNDSIVILCCLTSKQIKEFDKLPQSIKLLCLEAKSLLSTMEFKDVSWFNSSNEEVKEKTVIKLKKEVQIKIQKDKLSQDLEEIERKLNSLKF